VHVLCDSALIRKASQKIDALAVMIDNERSTYERWLSEPQLIRVMIDTYFAEVHAVEAWGKLNLAARKCV
jgi:hypothetical protein